MNPATIALALISVLVSPRDTARTASGLWYSVTGTGPTIVFLHGSNLDSRSWGTLPTELAKAHRVVQVDLRSHGRSAEATGPFSWRDDVIEVLDAVHADRATLLGLSLGAVIALDAALEFPSRVDRLILMGPAISGMAMKPRPGYEGMMAALQKGDFAAAGEELGRAPVMRLFRDTSRQAEVRGIVNENTRLFRGRREWLKPFTPPAMSRLDQLRVPVLVLVGEKDPTDALDAAEIFREKVSTASIVTIPGCGHLLPLDCPSETVAAVLTFLRTP